MTINLKGKEIVSDFDLDEIEEFEELKLKQKNKY